MGSLLAAARGAIGLIGGRRGRVGYRSAAVCVASMAFGMGATHAWAQRCDPLETAKLLASNGTALDDFGRSASLDGGTAVVGSRNTRGNSCNGRVHVFVLDDGEWVEQAELVPDNQGACELFAGGAGTPVSVSGDTAIVGAIGGRDGNGVGTGAVYVFVRVGEEWSQQARLVPDDGPNNATFGHSVAIDGDVVVIGAQFDNDLDTNVGSAYVFTRAGEEWTQRAKLLPSDGAPRSANFGAAVAIRGGTILVGEPRDDEQGSDSGSAYIYVESGGAWSEQAKLLPSIGWESGHFGWSVSVDGDTALVGERRGDPSGAAYVFTRTAGVWTEQAKLSASDASSGSMWEFGHAVGLNGEVAVVGAWQADDDSGVGTGAAYVYRRDVDTWVEQAKLLASDRESLDSFGSAVALSGDRALVGVMADDDNGNASGSAYIFDLHCAGCAADINGDGTVDTLDFLAFLGAWSAGDPLADWNGDGAVNTLDFLAYLQDWSAGCP